MSSFGQAPSLFISTTIDHTDDSGETYLADVTIEFVVYDHHREDNEFTFLFLDATLDCPQTDEDKLWPAEVNLLERRLGTDLLDKATDRALELYGELA